MSFVPFTSVRKGLTARLVRLQVMSFVRDARPAATSFDAAAFSPPKARTRVVHTRAKTNACSLEAYLFVALTARHGLSQQGRPQRETSHLQNPRCVMAL